jgi:hypothetical protein
VAVVASAPVVEERVEYRVVGARGFPLSMKTTSLAYAAAFLRNAESGAVIESRTVVVETGPWRLEAVRS